MCILSLKVIEAAVLESTNSKEAFLFYEFSNSTFENVRHGGYFNVSTGVLGAGRKIPSGENYY